MGGWLIEELGGIKENKLFNEWVRNKKITEVWKEENWCLVEKKNKENKIKITEH